ncbi:MAG: hypothetical protein ABSA09_00585 [Desulfobaccales bacterium]|jgi:hypothetical protein
MKKLSIFLLILCALCASAVNFALASQNALVVPDGTGAQVRAGFNNAIDSLNTVESGPSAPTTTEAYMLWCDTTNGLLKQRDSTNSTWIVLGTLGAAQMGHEPAITPGTTSQYWRGDKTWQTFPAIGTGANDLVQLNNSGQLPAVSGANLTNLPSTSMPIAQLSDTKASGIAGGTFTSGSWQNRTINTIMYDPSGIVTLIGDNVSWSLPAGTYRFQISAPAYAVNGHQIQLYNVTTSSISLLGTSEFDVYSTAEQTRSFIDGVVAITGTTTFEVQHRCVSTQTTYGFGYPCGFGNSEIYTIVTITKLQ